MTARRKTTPGTGRSASASGWRAIAIVKAPTRPQSSRPTRRSGRQVRQPVCDPASLGHDWMAGKPGTERERAAKAETMGARRTRPAVYASWNDVEDAQLLAWVSMYDTRRGERRDYAHVPGCDRERSRREQD